jgi:hypothetical protein
MPNIGQDIVVNLISDLLSWLIVIAASFVFIRSFIQNRYKRLRCLFGLTGNSDRLLVYLSSLPVAKHGLVNRFGKRHSFDQLTLTVVEVETTSWLTVLFAADPLTRLPESTQQLFRRFWAYRPVSLDIRPSPLTEVQLEFTDMLIVGGPLFNSAAKYYQDKDLSRLAFKVADDYSDKSQWTSIEITKGKDKGLNFSTNEEIDIGFIQRLHDAESNKTIIWAAGARTNGTKAALYYLTQHWDMLSEKLGKDDAKEMAICFHVPARKIDPDGYRKPVICYQWP